MALARRFTPEDDRRFYVYVIKHNGTPIWVGLGSGTRHEVRRHCTPTVTPDAKREYILRHLSEITSEIVFVDLTWAEAAEKESALIEEFGLVCDGTGPLFNRTYGAGYGDQVADGVLAEIKARKRAKREEQLRIAERIAKICDLATTTVLQKMNEYRKAGGRRRIPALARSRLCAKAHARAAPQGVAQARSRSRQRRVSKGRKP